MKPLKYIWERPWMGLFLGIPFAAWAIWHHSNLTKECENAKGELFRSFFVSETVCVKPDGILWRR